MFKQIQHQMLQFKGFIQQQVGTVTTCGDFKIHTFTGDGTFSVN